MTSDPPRPVTDHLAEVRIRILKTLILFIIITCVLFGIAKDIMPYVLKPLDSVDDVEIISIGVLREIPDSEVGGSMRCDTQSSTRRY